MSFSFNTWNCHQRETHHNFEKRRQKSLHFSLKSSFTRILLTTMLRKTLKILGIVFLFATVRVSSRLPSFHLRAQLNFPHLIHHSSHTLSYSFVPHYIQPACAQFGIGRKKKEGTTFQDLQEKAAAANSGEQHHVAEEMADLAKLQEQFAGAFDANPELLKSFGADMQKAMDELAKMDPAELQKHMQQAMEQMTSGDVMDTLVEQKEALLQNLQETGMVSEEELAKFKNDPAYFESQMRDAMQQMQQMFSDPEMLKAAGETMKGMQEAFQDPAIADLTKLLEGGFEDDTKIEEARLQFLQNPQILDSPLFQAMFPGDEFQDILQDPKKWRDTIKEGMQLMQSAGMAGGVPGGAAGAGGQRVAGHGEL